MSPDLSNRKIYSYQVVYTFSYACGDPIFPHQGNIALDFPMPAQVVRQILEEKRRSLCPSCLIDRKYQEALLTSAKFQLKPLIGTERHKKLAEIVRASVVLFFFARTEEKQKRELFISRVNRPKNRQALLWANYRDASWDCLRYAQLIETLHDKHEKTHPVY